MLRTQTASLPHEQQQKVHPDFLANEQAHLRMRDSLLPQYKGQWVAIQDGKVIAAVQGLLDVMGSSSGDGHPYVALVGAEDAVIFRVRRAVFAYGPNESKGVLIWSRPSLRSGCATTPLPATHLPIGFSGQNRW